MQGQAVGLHPGRYLAQSRRCRRFRRTKDHEVIGITHHPVAALLHEQVERVQIQVGQERRQDRPLGRSRRWLPARYLRHDLLAQKAVDQCQNPAIADRTFHQRHQPVARDGIEIALQVGVHHMGVAFLQQPIDFPQRILAAPPWSKAIASGSELDFKDRLDDHLQRGLYDPVLHGRDPQRAGLAVPFGYLNPFGRVRPVGAVRQSGLEFQQIPFRLNGKPFHTLAVHPRRPLVPRDTLPRDVQCRRPDDLVDQAKPFTSFTPLPSADTMRSVQIEASAHHSPWGSSPPAASLPCVALVALTGFSCSLPVISHPASCLPSLGAFYAVRPSPPLVAAAVL